MIFSGNRRNIFGFLTSNIYWGHISFLENNGNKFITVDNQEFRVKD